MSAGVSVIVPARDAAATLESTLEALRGQEEVEPFELIVVDNGSEDDTAGVAGRAGATVVRRERGDGPGAARNAGVAAASGRILAFTDADCQPAPDWLARGLAALAGAALVQGAVVPDPRAELGPFDRTVAVSGPTGLFEAASLFVERAVFDQIGGFPAGLEAPGKAPFGEDALFGWAARRSGAQVGFCAAAVVHHAVTRRPVRGFIAERTRLRLFPALVARIPELRDELCFGRIFLSRRTATFDLAVAGILLARAGRRAAPLALTVPYLGLSAREATAWGGWLGARAAIGALLADAVGAGALVVGSVQSGRVVL
ncbi:MAG TPA: glycosyltransferase [Solirubrobacteraceae bacterium]|jgi:glycosyltransferase involved in cell wall biosynthesis|nr:glycosyltransferase [Solirubrobacteraceae bacterium]